MTKRITIPEGKIAVLLDQALANNLHSLFILLGRNAGRKVTIDPLTTQTAKEAWFDLTCAMQEAGCLIMMGEEA